MTGLPDCAFSSSSILETGFYENAKILGVEWEVNGFNEDGVINVDTNPN